MRNHGKRRSTGWMGIWMLALVSTGCGRCLMPAFLCANSSAAVSGPASESPGCKKAEPQPGLAAGSPGADGIMPAVYETPSQAVAVLTQKLAAVDDDRKVLLARLQHLEALLEARDQALAASAREVEAARTEVTTTHSEMDRWRADMAALQQRLRSVEKADMGTLESIIKLLEQAVDEGKELTPAKPQAGPS